MVRKIKKLLNPIIGEINETRRCIAEKFGYDIAAIAEDARKRQEAEGRPVWKGPSRHEPIVTPADSDASKVARQ